MNMFILSFLALIGLTIDCLVDPNHYKKELEEYKEKILKQLEKNNRRRLSKSIEYEYINPTSKINIGPDGIIEELFVKIKAKSKITKINLPTYYGDPTINSYKFEIKDNEGDIIPVDPTAHNCTVNMYKDIIINTYLYYGDELSLWLKVSHVYGDIKGLFLDKYIFVYIPESFGDTHCKYIFNLDLNYLIVRSEMGELSRLNSTAYIYDNDCPNSYTFELIRITPYQITWNVDMEASMSIIEAPNYGYLFMSNDYVGGGTNYNFTKNEFSMSNVNVGDTFIQNSEQYLLLVNNFTGNSERYIKMNLTFSTSPAFWNVTIDKFENTSTPETIALVKNILLKDTSSDPDFIKIGRWISDYMDYNYSYFGKSLNISQIIKLKQGVCHHYTLLYNALLNSIGIEAIYTSGYSVKDLDNPTDGRHAWTVAKIGDKWLGLDATWAIYTEYGYLPQCHLFQAFGGTGGISTSSNGGNVKETVKEDITLIEIVHFECVKPYKPYLDIHRSCKLCKEIDITLPYYDNNSGECVNKCSHVSYNSICYDNCEQIDNENTYIKNEKNECEIKNITIDNETSIDSMESKNITIDNETSIDLMESRNKNNSYSSSDYTKKTIIFIALYLIIIF